MLFPKVKKLDKIGDFSFPEDASGVQLKALSSLDEKAFSAVFGESLDNADIILSCKKDGSLEELSVEAYTLRLSEEKGRLYCDISACSDKGFVRALFTLKRMCIKNEFTLGEITDWPSFDVRGYIEGFYGKPWKSTQRPEMLELMALFGENTHYYAPKDDPYHRDKWKELYPENEASLLKELVDKANSLYVDFYYCIAPGLSMKYSSEEDFFCLKEKTKQLFSMGIRGFGLLLDDIPSDLFFPEDKEIFKNAARAHTALVKKYYEFLMSLSPDCRLTVCPTCYRGKGDENELCEFAANIPECVDVFFTGCDICSKEITSREAIYFKENTLHKPLYWDNYPVNDAEMFMEMHMGPLKGRDWDLYKYCAGLISNTMSYFNCNKIPLITVAAYLWNSEEYEPETAFSEAVSFVLPEDEREDFILLADHFRTSCLNDENSRIMGERLSSALMCRHTGNDNEALRILSAYTEEIKNAAERLKKRTSPVYTELSRWLKKFYLMSDILISALEVLKGKKKEEELALLMEEYNESATVLTSFCFREYIESVLGNEN